MTAAIVILPGLLSGVGVAVNYSYTTSRVTFPDGFLSAVPGGQGRIDHPTLQRQAPNTWNLGLTTMPNVDRNPILGIAGPLGDQHLYAHTQVDAQGSLHLYRGWRVVVSGLNLTNEVFGFYTGSSIYPNQREFYRPTATFGLRWEPSL